MESWKVVVPSYNRPDEFKSKTLATLKFHEIPASSIYLFVASEEQKVAYQRVLSTDDVGHIIVGEKGLPQIRNFIFNYFPIGTPIVSFDDDVRGFVILNGDKLRPLNATELKPLINLAFTECTRVGANLWGDYPVHTNAYWMSNTISFDLKFIKGSFWGCYNPGNEIQITIGSGEKEDYMRTIQFWERDGKIVRFNFLAHKTVTYGGNGGLQSDGAKARLDREVNTVNQILTKWSKYIRPNTRRKGPYPELLLIRQPFTIERKRTISLGV
jgi:hypothetical protein